MNKDNNQIIFDNQNNCQNQIPSMIMFCNNEPNPELGYSFQRKSEYVFAFVSITQIIPDSNSSFGCVPAP